MSGDGRLSILVLAVGGNVSQGILKALSRSALSHRVIGADVSADQAGLYTVDKGYILPWASDPAFLNALTGLCRKEKIEVILTGCEPVLDFLVAHREQIESESGAVCPVNTPEIHRIGDDKGVTCRWLEAKGLNVPQYAFSEEVEKVEALAARCGFPLIAKPRRGGGARGLLEILNREDLLYAMRKPGYVLQEYLGESSLEYTVGCFCDKAGDLKASIVLRRDLLAGTTYRAWVEEQPEVRREAERIVRELRPLGPCNVQLRLTPRGAVCFEINPRFSGTTPLRAALGFNEVDAFLRHFVLGREVCLPCITEGMVLRYWNELYVDPMARHQLSEAGELSREHRGKSYVENYGMKL